MVLYSLVRTSHLSTHSCFPSCVVSPVAVTFKARPTTTMSREEESPARDDDRDGPTSPVLRLCGCRAGSGALRRASWL